MTFRIAAVAALSLAAAASPAVAATDDGWCGSEDLLITVSEGRAPVAADRLFAIHLQTAGNGPCTIRGMLSEVRFLQGETDLDVPIAGGQPQEWPEFITVDADSEAVVYMSAPKKAKPQPVDHIRFILPGNGTRGDTVTVPWPSPVGGLVDFGIIVSPVS
ncbi:hypothetical protein BBK82_41145 [Lentzea guizhouensis]|uniref:DUF4232 domain-containing protein n=1 Tax=Lentzea guizhouensis TaxID=1586287 RepID=A0A1B2HUK0_9PSEU|nr:hypothetical protein [Lentzea guizhouensis]ANZ41420.1 hypothetical protein BBK82_41145 [Lentzea guizhouensis]